MSFSSVFIKRPVATSLLTVAIALAGIISYRFLPVAPLPQVDFPTIQVYAGLPGASPETMASSVATPLERQFGRIAGISEMTSSSSLGSSNVTLQFDLDRNIDAAGREVQAAINAARSQLPANLPSNPGYRKANPADSPVMMLLLTSDVIPRTVMYDVGSNILQQKISQVPGVGRVFIMGGALPAVRAEVNPTVINSHGLSLEDVRSAISMSNINRPTGDISDGKSTWSIDVTDKIFKAEDYGNIIIRYKDGAALRLNQVAKVSDSVQDLRNIGLTESGPAITVTVFRQPGANIIETVDRIRAILPELQAVLPPSVDLQVFMDSTRTIRASVADVQRTLLLSITLVILVVFIFLRDWRSTLVPMVVVPVTLVGTFGVMYLFGFSIDNLSLMALTIAIVFVVDDAIVVVENLTRHIEGGKSPMQAALHGAKEIGSTLVSISISLVAVFIPILMMGGIVGRLFREFAITLSIAIVISMTLSLTTTPMLCSRLLRRKSPENRGRLSRATESLLNNIKGRYERSLAWVFRHQRIIISVTVLAMFSTVGLYIYVPKGFFPQQDTGRLQGNIQASQDISFAALSKMLPQYVDIIAADPAVEHVSVTAGTGNSGRVTIALKPKKERTATADQVIARLRAKAAPIPGANMFLQSVQDIRVGGRMGGGALYQYTIQGDDANELFEWAPRLLTVFRSLPELTDVNTDQQNRGLQASLVIDRETAARLGISPQSIDATLYDAFGQRYVSTMYMALNQYRVVMSVSPEYAQTPDGLDYIYVRSTNGKLVPLSAFTKLERKNTSLSISHQGTLPAITFSFNLAQGYSLGDAVDAIQKAQDHEMMPGTIRGTFMGTARAFQDSLSNQPLLIAAALLTVYIVLGMLYESLIHPLTILSALPSAGVGALLALLAFKTELSVIALIGIILLIGIVKKNAILMVDFALAVERNENATPEQAIFKACLLRFRPIIMTTTAALLGGLPLALGTGTGSEFRRPLGISIVGGLVFSQMLTLYTTPVVYLYMARLKAGWTRFWQREKQATAVSLHGVENK
ncbi:MAG: multidrug efflux RND transporter permease subunit [Holophagaceae bacterium]|nr:multidrug efflux RND transporter permease subunit [Holophagaceae bacterium]